MFHEINSFDKLFSAAGTLNFTQLLVSSQIAYVVKSFQTLLTRLSVFYMCGVDVSDEVPFWCERFDALFTLKCIIHLRVGWNIKKERNSRMVYMHALDKYLICACVRACACVRVRVYVCSDRLLTIYKILVGNPYISWNFKVLHNSSTRSSERPNFGD